LPPRRLSRPSRRNAPRRGAFVFLREKEEVRREKRKSFLPSTFYLLPSTLPAVLPALILLLQVAHQRLEVLDHRFAPHLARAGEFVQRVLPRLACALLEHGPAALAGFLAAVEGALVQRAFVTGGFAQRLVELEPQDARQEVTRVRGV